MNSLGKIHKHFEDFKHLFGVFYVSSRLSFGGSYYLLKSTNCLNLKHKKYKTSCKTLSRNKIKMSEQNESKLSFVSQANPVTGKTEWVPVEQEDYDYIQEIARSGYGDMLHDVDRNVKYYKAIRKAIQLMKDEGKEVRVLDIGTGTGLLSMMAATSGADSITACEAFTPMANCARKVLKANNFNEKVRLIPKRSTDVKLGEDMPVKANLLVTELFDTELIGEGAIPSYTDAHKRLMDDECVAVPTLGIMYVQAVQSPLLTHWNGLHPITLPNGSVVSVPPEFGQCSGAPSLHDLQVDELQDELVFLSDPIEVFRFDFTKKNGLKKYEECAQSVKALSDGVVDAFIMWWDLQMEPLGHVILSCAPCWTRQSGEPIPWRDHWMQAVYYPSSRLEVKKEHKFDIHSFHDEYSLWFDTKQLESTRPICTCGLHITMSRSRLAQMNCPLRNHVFISALEKHLDASKTCLVISDGSLLPLIAAKMGAHKVFCIDDNPASMKVLRRLVQVNKLEERIVFLTSDMERISSEDFQGHKIDVVIAEPYFQGVQLPWQHLFFWYALSSLKSCLSANVVILPQAMTIKTMAVQFRDLHKIRAPVGNCEGFDISHFDELIDKSSSDVDEVIEPQPLWEYPCTSLSSQETIMTLDFSQPPQSMEDLNREIVLKCTRPGTLNGVAFWTEFTFDENQVLNCGLQTKEGLHGKLRWDKTSKQGVHLFHRSRSWKINDSLSVDVSFNPSNGDFSFALN